MRPPRTFVVGGSWNSILNSNSFMEFLELPVCKVYQNVSKMFKYVHLALTRSLVNQPTKSITHTLFRGTSKNCSNRFLQIQTPPTFSNLEPLILERLEFPIWRENAGQQTESAEFRWFLLEFLKSSLGNIFDLGAQYKASICSAPDRLCNFSDNQSS